MRALPSAWWWTPPTRRSGWAPCSTRCSRCGCTCLLASHRRIVMTAWNPGWQGLGDHRALPLCTSIVSIVVMPRPKSGLVSGLASGLADERARMCARSLQAGAKRIWTVVGCDGERDEDSRSRMGAVSGVGLRSHPQEKHVACAKLWTDAQQRALLPWRCCTTACSPPP